MTKQRISRIKKQIVQSRTRLLLAHPFYALLLMHLDFIADTKIWTMSTNGRAIFFNPDYFEKLPTDETDFILCHQVMHILFEDINRNSELSGHTYHHACDIVINSHLCDDVLDRDDFHRLGKIYHTIQKGEFNFEGKFFDADEVYQYCRSVPDYDEVLKNGIMIDNDKWWGKLKYPKDDKTLTLIIKGDLDDPLAIREIDGRGKPKGKNPSSGGGENGEDGGDGNGKNGDNESREDSGGENSGDGLEISVSDDGEDCNVDWKTLIAAAMDAALQLGSSSNGAANIPAFAQRLVSDLKRPKTDWKKILNDFIQEETCDYSFSPPDRRFDGSDFFLPDFNEKDFVVKKVLFMVDTSGSMADEMINLAYAEISGAISQYNGKLEGELGFFDAEITEPVSFDSVNDILSIIPVGGGGTDFFAVFDYIAMSRSEDKPSAIIIFTDGDAYFPDESAAIGIPVLWMINNYEVTPPWGKTVRCVLD